LDSWSWESNADCRGFGNFGECHAALAITPDNRPVEVQRVPLGAAWFSSPSACRHHTGWMTKSAVQLTAVVMMTSIQTKGPDRRTA